MSLGKPIKTQVGLKLNGTCELLVYAEDVSVFGHNINTIKENISVLIDACKEVGDAGYHSVQKQCAFLAAV
jgi:hypothetical protein